MLGGALLGQKQYADAEPLLLDRFDGLKHRNMEIPTSFRAIRVTEALPRLIGLYPLEQALRSRKMA